MNGIRQRVRYITIVGILVLLLVGWTSQKNHITQFPTHTVFDYQLSGGYPPAPGVGGVVRDSSDLPVHGVFSICYVNGFQSQPGERNVWLNKHKALLLVDAKGKPISDCWTPRRPSAVTGLPSSLIAQSTSAQRRASRRWRSTTSTLTRGRAVGSLRTAHLRWLGFMRSMLMRQVWQLHRRIPVILACMDAIRLASILRCRRSASASMNAPRTRMFTVGNSLILSTPTISAEPLRSSAPTRRFHSRRLSGIGISLDPATRPTFFNAVTRHLAILC
jgi:hypothetical protein